MTLKFSGCFEWNHGIPSLKNDTINFHKIYNDTMKCIIDNMLPQNNDVCNRCMQSYLQLDEFYMSLSSDSIGVDSVCIDIVDSVSMILFCVINYLQQLNMSIVEE